MFEAKYRLDSGNWHKKFLFVLLATRDAISPLKVIVLPVRLCVWPLWWACWSSRRHFIRYLIKSYLSLIRTMRKKHLLPMICIPSSEQMKELLQYVSPLIFVIATRLIGFVSMQRAVMRLEVTQLASYELCFNPLFFLYYLENHSANCTRPSSPLY